MKTAEEILKNKIVPFNVAEYNFLHHVLHSGEIYKLILAAMEEYADAVIAERTPTNDEENKAAEKFVNNDDMMYEEECFKAGCIWFRSRMKGGEK